VTHFDPEIVELFSALWEPLDSHVTTGGISRLTKRSKSSHTGKLELLPYVTEAK